ncbi:MAG: aminotransferase class I/II-fold pyridoxal phosphate-dependent enzyme [Polyangiaceae bacterium]
MTQESYRFDTLKVRAGYDPREHNLSVAVPIYQTVSYELGSTERVDRLLSFDELGWLYTRIGNPTVSVLEQRIAALDGGTGAIALASGMAAVSYALLNVAEGGGRILTTPRLYGGTFDALKKLFPAYGIQIDFVDDPDDVRSYRAALRVDTKAVLIESISNPDGALLDLQALANVAHEHGVPLLVDNTFATPYLFNPFQHGADIIIYSATKGIGGHGAALGGLIVENGSFKWDSGKFPQFQQSHFLLRDRKTNRERNILELFPTSAFTMRVRLTHLAYLGAALGPFDAFLILQGVETLSERIAKQTATTERLVAYLDAHPKVAWVKHSSARDSRYQELARRYFPKGTGSVFTFGLRASRETHDKFINSVRLFSYQANVGDARSLIINSARTTHGELTAEEQRSAGIVEDTIRLSIGLEDPQDLISDLEQAFAKAFV